MVTRKDIESYLLRMGHPFEEAGEGMWVVRDEATGSVPIVISYQPSITVFRVKLMDKPEGNNVALYEKLLELNATELISGAYGIEDDTIVCTETLQTENLDFNEFQAAVEGMVVAITEHYPVLNQFRPAVRG